MENEVICVDGSFPSDYLSFYREHGVTTPVEGKMYSFREIIKNTRGTIGVLLNEIVNPKVPDPHPILGNTMREPDWKIERFSNLDGSELTREQAIEIERQDKIFKPLNF